MTEDKPRADRPSSSGQEQIPEERFRYIGFEVFPKHIREFWKSDGERQEHVAHVRETGGRFVPLSRSNSMVAAGAISLPERITLTLTSALLAVSPFMPWFSFTRGDTKFSYSGISLLLNWGPVREFLALGSGLLNLSYLMLLVLMLVSAAFGVATLVFLYSAAKDTSDAYLLRLHRILVWHYVPIVGWLVFLGITAPPTDLPFGPSLGLAEVSDHLSIASLSTSSSVGLWIPFATLWVNAIKGNEL